MPLLVELRLGVLEDGPRPVPLDDATDHAGQAD
jgi:hypothetical protein